MSSKSVLTGVTIRSDNQGGVRTNEDNSNVKGIENARKKPTQPHAMVVCVCVVRCGNRKE